MKKLMLVLICSLIFINNTFSESPIKNHKSTISYLGGDGTSVKTAIVIIGAKSEMDGVNSEYEWLREKLPSAKQLSQTTINEQNRLYDCIEVKLPDETTRRVYFDITEFFGKL